MPGYEATENRLRCVLPFEADPAELSVLRRAARTQLAVWGLTAAVGDVQLAITELATNIIKHVGAGAPATLVLERCAGRVRVELHDQSQKVPTPLQATCDEECGRGLHMLAAMARDCGTLLTASGKAVWCELPIEPGQNCFRIQRAASVLESYGREVAELTQWPIRCLSALEDVATNLIADLLHWLVAQGGDPDDFLDRAQMHYEADSEAA
ncbi:ATP-binding protein [Streptomyces sp. 7N604]|uniref:ATP-binding protein n=1 Tax=Streptomyces sp. 7N604 TaxID=3457415 RepID=UPI003FD0D72F